MDYVNEIFEKVKELRPLGINNFQDGEGVAKHLNVFFGFNDDKYTFCEHGVQSVHFMEHYAIIEYRRGWNCETNVYLNLNVGYCDKTSKITGVRSIKRNATESEIKGVYEYIRSLIDERKAELEKSVKNPDFETSKNSLGKFADNYLSRNYPKFECRQRYGSTEVDKTRRFAFVICSKEEDDAMAQMGYISFSRNDNGEYGFKVSSLGISYNCGTSDFSECEKILGNAIDFILN